MIRGANVGRYAVRDASQGRGLFLKRDAFTDGADESGRAFHHRHARVVWQEASPQNNFRRIIAAPLPVGRFCSYTTCYAPGTPVRRVDAAACWRS